MIINNNIFCNILLVYKNFYATIIFIAVGLRFNYANVICLLPLLFPMYLINSAIRAILNSSLYCNLHYFFALFFSRKACLYQKKYLPIFLHILFVLLNQRITTQKLKLCQILHPYCHDYIIYQLLINCFQRIFFKGIYTVIVLYEFPPSPAWYFLVYLNSHCH